MHDPFCTLDLKLYSFLPGGQIYILLFFIFVFLQSASLNHIIRKKGFTLFRSLVSDLHENTQTVQHHRNSTDDIQSGIV